MGTPRTYRPHDGIFTTFFKCTKRGLLKNHHGSRHEMRQEAVQADFQHMNGDGPTKNHYRKERENNQVRTQNKLEGESQVADERFSLLQKLEEKEKEVSRLKEELERQELEMSSHKEQYNDVLKDLSLATKAKNNMCIQLVEQEKRVARLEQCLALPVSSRLQQRQELQVVREAIASLRLCFASNHPHQHTLDTIEQSIATLCERVNAIENNKSETASIPAIDEASGFSSPVDQTYAECAWNQATPQLRAGGTSNPYYRNHRESRHLTKVLYFMSRSTSPFQCTIHKRVNEITLRDFKIVFDRPGQYRFHFKSLDPVYGAVKEEISHDDDLLPSWEGKIIAWVEEENG